MADATGHTQAGTLTILSAAPRLIFGQLRLPEAEAPLSAPRRIDSKRSFKALPQIECFGISVDHRSSPSYGAFGGLAAVQRHPQGSAAHLKIKGTQTTVTNLFDDEAGLAVTNTETWKR